MQNLEIFLSNFSGDERLLHNFISFPQFFSVDWLPQFPPSKVMALILFLEKQHWIVSNPENPGYYSWSSDLPRQQIIDQIPPAEMAEFYRNSVNILIQQLPEGDSSTLTIAHQCLLAGLQEKDLEIIARAAGIEEENHQISSAIELYDAILKFMESLIEKEESPISETTWYLFIKAIEHRASLSLFHPSLKKLNRLLLIALDAARNLGDLKTQAYLELLTGQHYWMSFQYKQAIQHFDQGWDIIKQIEDEGLYKQGLKVQGLTYIIKGQFFKAIEAYEQSLGELESAINNNFFLLAALNLALCYTQVGMPQRGLGISERIQNYCEKNLNLPILSIALATSGMIFLEIKQFKKGRLSFGRALEFARRDNLPMVEVIAGIGLASIECQEGNFESAAEHYKVLWRIRKSSWYYVLNFYPLIDTGYILHSRGISPIELKPVFDFLYQLKKD